MRTQPAAAVRGLDRTGYDVHQTKEPCATCAGAIVNTRIRRVIFGFADPRESERERRFIASISQRPLS